MESKELTELDQKFKNYLEKKKSLEYSKFYFEQCNNDQEIEHYEMKLYELEQSPEAIQYKKLKEKIPNEGQS